MLLWCLLTGRVHAWMDDSGHTPGISAVAQQVQRGDRPDCGQTTLRGDAPTTIVALMKRAWAKKPADRPTAAVAADVIARAITGRPGQVRSPAFGSGVQAARPAASAAQAPLPTAPPDTGRWIPPETISVASVDLDPRSVQESRS